MRSLLLLRAHDADRVPDHRDDGQAVGGRIDECALFGEYPHLPRVATLAAVFNRPRRTDPAASSKPAMDVPIVHGAGLVDTRNDLRGHVLGKERPHLVAELLGVLGRAEVDAVRCPPRRRRRDRHRVVVEEIAETHPLTRGSPATSGHPRERRWNSCMSPSRLKPRPPWYCIAVAVTARAVSVAVTNAADASTGVPLHAASNIRSRAPSRAAARSANWCCTAWNEPMGTPNWWRSCHVRHRSLERPLRETDERCRGEYLPLPTRDRVGVPSVGPTGQRRRRPGRRAVG